MRKTLANVGLAAVAALVFSTPAFAQATATGAVNVTVNVNARARLTLSSASVTFADADPDSVPTMTAAPLTISVGARTSSTGNITLTVLASGNLTSGSDAIGISNLTWSATGTGFQAGTSNATTAQTVGSWTGSGAQSGSQTFSLPNSWSYVPGTYQTTLNYTLTVP
jgi:hypothetical protein